MPDAPDPYAQPQPISDIQLAFPANLGTLLPPMESIPTNYPHKDYWTRIQHDWFAGTLPDDFEMHANPGIDAQTAGRHLSALNGSYEPKHEHKIAAVAWLASRWFTTP